jgi:hypothetical protein
MADFSLIDPWTTVINQLWTLLEANTDFCDVVKVSNRIKITRAQDQNPIKANIQNSDTPEVLITLEQASERPAHTSRQASSEQNFTVQIITLDLRLQKEDHTGANDIRWLVWKILLNGGDTLGLDFVYKARITSSLQHYIDPVTRGTVGWCVFFTISCNLQLPKDYIL